MFNRKNFYVDFTTTRNGVPSRQSRVINQSQLPENAGSEFAVQQFLQKQFQGTTVTINEIRSI